MKAAEIEIGGTYTAKVSGKLVKLRVTFKGERSVNGNSLRYFWRCLNLWTGREIHVNSCQRFRERVDVVPTSPPIESREAKCARLAQTLDAIAKSSTTLILHTTAPEAYDGFSTRTLAIVGEDKRGRPIRMISVESRDYEWQTLRYGSGLHAFTTIYCTLEGYLKFGDWTLYPEPTILDAAPVEAD